METIKQLFLGRFKELVVRKSIQKLKEKQRKTIKDKNNCLLLEKRIVSPPLDIVYIYDILETDSSA